MSLCSRLGLLRHWSRVGFVNWEWRICVTENGGITMKQDYEREFEQFIKKELPGFRLQTVEELREMGTEEVYKYMESLGKLKGYCEKRKMQIEVDLERNKKDREKIMAELKEKYQVETAEGLESAIGETEKLMAESLDSLEIMLPRMAASVKGNRME